MDKTLSHGAMALTVLLSACADQMTGNPIRPRGFTAGSHDRDPINTVILTETVKPNRCEFTRLNIGSKATTHETIYVDRQTRNFSYSMNTVGGPGEPIHVSVMGNGEVTHSPNAPQGTIEVSKLLAGPINDKCEEEIKKPGIKPDANGVLSKVSLEFSVFFDRCVVHGLKEDRLGPEKEVNEQIITPLPSTLNPLPANIHAAISYRNGADTIFDVGADGKPKNMQKGSAPPEAIDQVAKAAPHDIKACARGIMRGRVPEISPYFPAGEDKMASNVAYNNG